MKYKVKKNIIENFFFKSYREGYEKNKNKNNLNKYTQSLLHKQTPTRSLSFHSFPQRTTLADDSPLSDNCIPRLAAFYTDVHVAAAWPSTHQSAPNQINFIYEIAGNLSRHNCIFIISLHHLKKNHMKRVVYPHIRLGTLICTNFHTHHCITTSNLYSYIIV